MDERKGPEHFHYHLTQDDMNRVGELMKRREAGEQIPLAEQAAAFGFLFQEPSDQNFVSLADELSKFQNEAGVPSEQATELISIGLAAFRDSQRILHFATPNRVLGPGRLMGFDLERRTVTVQLSGDYDLQEFSFDWINSFGAAPYDNPKNVGQTLLGAFWEARTTRKYLERMVTNSYARLSPEEIDSFGQVANVRESDVINLIPLELSEAEVKEHICAIVGEPFARKDWGGETCDIFCNLTFRRRSVPAAFVLKGKAYANRPLRIADLGKNGDQLVRMFSLQAQLFVVQSNGPIDGTVYNHVQAQVAEKLMSNQPVYYLIMDGVQTARLLRAYNKI